jgi:hypothetical protein
VAFIVVGGVAAVLEGAPISTFDLDIVYSLETENVARLADALGKLNAVDVDPGGRTIRPTVRHLQGSGPHLLRTRHGRLDVMGSMGDGLTYPDLVSRSRVRTVRGLEIQIQVLGLETLNASKEAADRPKDRAVLDLLRETLAQRGRQSGD